MSLRNKEITPREKQVLALVAQGLTNKEIGTALGISYQTIKNHITFILFKLDARNRAHAVVLARDRGLL